MTDLNIQRRMRAEIDDASLLRDTAQAAIEYMHGVRERAVFPPACALAGLAIFDEALPQASSQAKDVLRLLHEHGSPATVAQTGGRYFGFVNGNVLPAALAARWLADTWDQNAALHVMSPIAAKLEQVAESWLVDLFGLDTQTVAGLVGGTSMATFCGLAAARNALLARAGWDVNARGLCGSPPLRVVAGEQAHATVFKALALLGFGRDGVEMVRADGQGRIDPAAVPALDANTLLLLQAGNVNTGAFDDFENICARARDAGAWVHIDGAFGLWAAASDSTRHLCAGIELADSWSADAHKTLNTPYDCGIVLCRHRDQLVAAMQASGAYFEFGAQRDGMLLVPEMSRRARGVELWAALKYLGRDGLDRLIAGLCERAREFAADLGEAGFQILNEVAFNQVLIAGDDPQQTERVLAAVQQSGELWCGGTQWNGAPAIRISVCSWATTSDDVRRAVAAFSVARGSTARSG